MATLGEMMDTHCLGDYRETHKRTLEDQAYILRAFYDIAKHAMGPDHPKWESVMRSINTVHAALYEAKKKRDGE